MPYIAGSNFEADMAMTPHVETAPRIEESFVADRAVFWRRFTNFTKYAVMVVIALLLILLVFVY